VDRRGAKRGMGKELTQRLTPTIVCEDEVRIPALGHPEPPSDAVGYGFPGAWNESKLGFHHFNLLNTRVKSQHRTRIS
jgi:hypothetical protein